MVQYAMQAIKCIDLMQILCDPCPQNHPRGSIKGSHTETKIVSRLAERDEMCKDLEVTGILTMMEAKRNTYNSISLSVVSLLTDLLQNCCSCGLECKHGTDRRRKVRG